MVVLTLSCQPPPVAYLIKQGSPLKPGLVVHLPGFRSQIPPGGEALAGLPGLSVQDDREGVKIDIPGRGIDLESVRLEGVNLVLGIRPGRSPAAGGDGVSDAAISGGTLYRVGPGDRLAVSVFEHPDLSQTVTVLANGAVRFPLIGDVLVAGLTSSEIARRLSEQLERGYVVSPQVSVGVSEYQSQSVNVMGEFARQGKYFLKGETRLIDILSETGGVTDNAGPDIVITRQEVGENGQPRSRQIRVSRDALYSSDNSSANVMLVSGDIVHAEPAPVFYVWGEVGRPGQFALRVATTLQKAVSLAGGFTQWANQKEIRVTRGSGKERKIFRLNLRRISRGEEPDFKIEPDDIIEVPRSIL